MGSQFTERRRAGDTAVVDWIDRGALRGRRLLVCGELGVMTVDIQTRDESVREQVRKAIAVAGVHRELQEQLTQHVMGEFGGTCYAGLLEFDPDAMQLSASLVAASAEFTDRDSIARKAGSLLVEVVNVWGQWLGREIADNAHYALRPAWKPTRAVVEAGWPTISREPEAELGARLGRLNRNRHEARRGRWLGLFVTAGSTVVLLGAVALALVLPDSAMLFSIAVGGVALLYLGVGLFAWVSGVANVRDADTDIQRITEEIDLRHKNDTNQGERAEKLFLSHGSDLKRYYDQALGQAKNVYYVGVASLLLGVVVVLGTLVLIATGVTSGTRQQIVVGALGVVTALLSNYIAVVYLRMFSDTVSAMTGFHSRLVSTHHLHFANLLTTKIEDPHLRDAAFAEMAAGLSNNGGPKDGAGAGDPSFSQFSPERNGRRGIFRRLGRRPPTE
jgi:hypothetical protein